MSYKQISPLLALLSVVAFLLPSASYSEVSFWMPCSQGQSKTEGRTENIEGYLNIDTIGMEINEAEELTCVTHIECVALGYCDARSPEEKSKAARLKPEITAKLARKKHELQAKVERKRNQAQQERSRKQAVLAAEKARHEKEVASEAKRLKISAEDARRLLRARENAREKMPPRKDMCTVSYPASTAKLNLTQILTLLSDVKKSYAALDRFKICNGHPGMVGPLQCSEPPTNLFGLTIAGNCTAEVRCPAPQELKPCNRVKPI